MITSMVNRMGRQEICIGSVQGYIYKFDIRGCSVSNMYCLKDKQICSLKEFFPYNNTYIG